MALKPCKECGREVSTQAKACPQCGANDPTGSQAAEQRENQLAATRGLMIGCLAPLVLLLGFCTLSNLGSSGGRASAPRPASTTRRDAGDITASEFSAVKAALEQTPGVRVERDPKATNTVRVYLSRGDLTEYQARKLATETRARLGANAIVYIKDDTGRTLAKAAAWGVSN